MIGRSTLPLAAFVLTTTVAAPAALAAYDGNDAIRACQKQITSSYGLDDFYGVGVDEKKAGRDYNVSGTVRIKDASDQPFSCRIRDRSVKEASVENVDKGDSGSGLFGGKEAGAAAVVGALATGAAALLGGGATGTTDGTAATGAQSNDAAGITWGQGPALGGGSAATSPSTSTSTTSTSTTSTGTSAATTTRSNLELREACGDALRTKLQKAGSSPRQILLDSVDVDDRAVRSKGLLIWQGGRRSDLSVTCNWDRSGKLYVADYSVK